MISKPHPPNLLLAIADDASHFGCYGHRFVRTPVIDRLAREGAVFTQAFTTNPKCAPSRASILTGRHTWQLEEACNHYSLFPAKFAVYPDVLEAAGYVVGFTGKGWAPGDWQTSGRFRNPAGPEFNARRLTPPEKTKISDIDYFGNFLDFLGGRKPGQPFCFWFGAIEPHRPYEEGEGLRAAKQLPHIDSVPPYWPDEPVVRSDMLDYAREIEWLDAQLGRFVEHLARMGELENTLLVVTSDNGAPFPRVKGQMYDDDFRLPFVVRWAAGCPAGRTVDDLVSFIDIAPTFLELAGLSVSEFEMVGRSLVPLLDSTRSGVLDPDRAFVVMGGEKHDLGREHDQGYPVRCIRSHEMLYVRNLEPERWPAGNPETGFTNTDSSPTKRRILELNDSGESRFFDLAFGKRPAEELYQIRSDPHCMRNLAADPGYRSVKDELSEKLDQVLLETGDPRQLGLGEIFETYPYVGESSHSWRRYLEGTWEPQKY